MLGWCRDRLDGWTDWLYPVWSPLTKGRCTQTHLKVGFSSGSSGGAIIRTFIMILFIFKYCVVLGYFYNVGKITRIKIIRNVNTKNYLYTL